jgi:cyclophilin family peptidyl-prolyl cis-trans isomerase
MATPRVAAWLVALGLPVLGSTWNAAAQPAAEGDKPVVVLTTTFGEIELELDAAKAPVTTKNFLRYVDEGFYDGLIFHRVISGFMVQGGGFTPAMQQKQGHEPIQNEAANGLKNLRGTIAMARTSDPNSASSQFFINHADNAFLNHTAPTQQGWGYAVFGQVTRGMDVVDKIAAVKTGKKSGMSDVPLDAVAIISARRKK